MPSSDVFADLIKPWPSGDGVIVQDLKMSGDANALGNLINNLATPVLSGDAANKSYIDVIHSSQQDPTGFESTGRTDTTLSFADVTRKLSIAKVNDYVVYQDGIRYPKASGEDFVIADTEGTHYIYFDEGSLVESVNPGDSALEGLFIEKPLVAVVYWDATNDKGVFVGDERHGMNWSGGVHSYTHFITGTVWHSGLSLGNMDTDGNGNDDTASQMSVGDGEIHDEDLEVDIEDDNPQELSTIAEIPVLYLDSSDWRTNKVTAVWVADTAYSEGDKIVDSNSYFLCTTAGTSAGANPGFSGDREPGDTVVDNAATWTCIGSPRSPVINMESGGYRLAYNDSGSQTEVGNLQYVLAHIFATTDINNPILAIQGQATYTNIITAREGATTELDTLIIAGLPGPEMKAIATVIFQTGTAYANQVKARTRVTGEGEDFVDWRSAGVSSALGSINKHSDLQNLNWADAGHSIDENFDFNTFKGVNCVDPTANQDVATKKYVDDNLTPPSDHASRHWNGGADEVDLAKLEPSGDVSWAGNKITDLATCTASGDAANKKYVDAVSGDAAHFFDRGDPATVDWTHATLTNDSAWHELDVSSIVPAGTKAILLVTSILTPDINDLIAFRKLGNSNNINRSIIYAQVANQQNENDMFCAVDSNGKAEYIIAANAGVGITVAIKGWWK